MKKLKWQTKIENGRISNFQRHLTFTLDRAVWHTVMHHSSNSTYVPNFIEMDEKFIRRPHLNFLPSSKSRDTITTTMDITYQISFNSEKLCGRTYIRMVRTYGQTDRY